MGSHFLFNHFLEWQKRWNLLAMVNIGYVEIYGEPPITNIKKMLYFINAPIVTTVQWALV